MNIRDIDLNLLIVFHRIYETRSISAAADLLDLSQPGMSHALKRLRTQLDDKLFVRKGNGVEPTVYADTIAEPIRNAISFLETSLAPPTAFDPKTSKRAFRILMADFLEPLIMPRLIAAVIDNPDITIELVSPQSVKIEDALLAGQIDLSVYLPCALLEEFRADPIAPLDMVLCYRLGHPITREPNPLAAMHKYRLIAPNLRSGAVRNLDKVSIDIKDPMIYFCLVSSLRSIPALLSESDCLSTLPRLYALSCADRYNLGYLAMPFQQVNQNITINWHRKTEHDPAITWLRNMIRSTLVDLKTDADATII